VSVCVDETDGGQTVSREDLEDPGGLVPRIDDERFLREGVRHDRAVACQRADGEGLDECQHMPILGRTDHPWPAGTLGAL